MRFPGLAGFIKILPSLIVVAVIVLGLYLLIRFIIWPKILKPLWLKYEDWKLNRTWKEWQYRQRNK